jgi:hypothetical protein
MRILNPPRRKVRRRRLHLNKKVKKGIHGFIELYRIPKR